MKQELKTLAKALTEELKLVLSDLPEETTITAYEHKDYASINSETISFKLNFGKSSVFVLIDRPTAEKS